MTPAQRRYAKVLAARGACSPAALARIVYAGNHAMTQLRPGRGRGRRGNAAAAVGALGNLAAGRVLGAMLRAGFVYYADDDRRRYILTPAGHAALARAAQPPR